MKDKPEKLRREAVKMRKLAGIKTRGAGDRDIDRWLEQLADRLEYAADEIERTSRSNETARSLWGRVG